MKTVNNPTAQEIKLAKKVAYNFVMSSSHIVLGHDFNYDARTRIGCLSSEFVSKLKNKIDRSEIRSIRVSRRESKPAEFTNILSNKLLIDLQKNSVKHINPNVANFYGRNHHAKNDQDRRVLAVFAKYRNA